MAKFAAGPWRVDGTVALGSYGVWTDYETHPGHDGAGYPSEVCSVFRGNKADFPQEVRDANAKLIAAAPDLLAALQMAYDWKVMNAAAYEEKYYMRHGEQDMLDTCRAAIAKATE